MHEIVEEMGRGINLGNVLSFYLLHYKYELDIDSKKGMISISSKHKFEQCCVFLSFCLIKPISRGSKFQSLLGI